MKILTELGQEKIISPPVFAWFLGCNHLFFYSLHSKRIFPAFEIELELDLYPSFFSIRQYLYRRGFWSEIAIRETGCSVFKTTPWEGVATDDELCWRTIIIDCCLVQANESPTRASPTRTRAEVPRSTRDARQAAWRWL